ncbi:hypothetical protein KDD30_06115 [Photobacterium sp. GJ3]|uniref:hypothetical protein n=1 Tax=Photobacterium sp. GJ3 TaxID=2829502 RepID=UPI001B8D351D|nr:hypothetical protein [Photobacterium sp. GJ3]QUJ68679.1 hypothetical protein KDD30_06115 [Photobacterium sp. GJ3]
MKKTASSSAAIPRERRPDGLQKLFLWLIVLDYFLLSHFLLRMDSMTLNAGTTISFLLFGYNGLLAYLCFKRARRSGDFYIIYPTLAAILLAFILFLYFFFLIA